MWRCDVLCLDFGNGGLGFGGGTGGFFGGSRGACGLLLGGAHQLILRGAGIVGSGARCGGAGLRCGGFSLGRGAGGGGLRLGGATQRFLVLGDLLCLGRVAGTGLCHERQRRNREREDHGQRRRALEKTICHVKSLSMIVARGPGRAGLGRMGDSITTRGGSGFAAGHNFS